MAAFRLASKSKTMADSSYESEVHGIEAFLAMQRNKDNFKNPTAPGGVSSLLVMMYVTMAGRLFNPNYV